MAISKTVFESYRVKGDQIPLDLIIWRRYKAMTPGLVEATYDLNEGLAQLGMELPHNTAVSIPVDTAPATLVLPLKKLF